MGVVWGDGGLRDARKLTNAPSSLIPQELHWYSGKNDSSSMFCGYFIPDWTLLLSIDSFILCPKKKKNAKKEFVGARPEVLLPRVGQAQGRLLTMDVNRMSICKGPCFAGNCGLCLSENQWRQGQALSKGESWAESHGTEIGFMEVTSDTEDYAFHRRIYCSQFPEEGLHKTTLQKVLGPSGCGRGDGRHARRRTFIVVSAGRAMGGSGGRRV